MFSCRVPRLLCFFLESRLCKSRRFFSHGVRSASPHDACAGLAGGGPDKNVERFPFYDRKKTSLEPCRTPRRKILSLLLDRTRDEKRGEGGGGAGVVGSDADATHRSELIEPAVVRDFGEPPDGRAVSRGHRFFRRLATDPNRCLRSLGNNYDG